MEKPECKLIGEDGNVFAIIGAVKKKLRKEGTPENLESFNIELEKIMKEGGSYDDILCLITRYVDVI